MHPAHQVLTPWIEAISQPWRLPTLAELNGWRGNGPRFGPAECSSYEMHIAEQQEVPTRPDNWHDAFNALCWLAWPQTKRAINAAHVQILRAGGEAERRRRSPERDVLTLFDEGGAVLLYSDADLLQALLARQWRWVLQQQRDRLLASARLLLLGHASLDELRQPRLGITAKILPFAVDAATLALPLPALRELADRLAATRLADVASLGRGRDHPPLPLLGWPGWHPHNADPAFYDDVRYFRPGQEPARQKRSGLQRRPSD